MIYAAERAFIAVTRPESLVKFLVATARLRSRVSANVCSRPYAFVASRPSTGNWYEKNWFLCY